MTPFWGLKVECGLGVDRFRSKFSTEKCASKIDCLIRFKTKNVLSTSSLFSTCRGQSRGWRAVPRGLHQEPGGHQARLNPNTYCPASPEKEDPSTRELLRRADSTGPVSPICT